MNQVFLTLWRYQGLSTLSTANSQCLQKTKQVKDDCVVTVSWPEELTGQTGGCDQRWLQLYPFTQTFGDFTKLVVLQEDVCVRASTKMPAETFGGSTPSHVWTGTFQCSSTNLRGRGQACYWTHAPRDIWGNRRFNMQVCRGGEKRSCEYHYYFSLSDFIVKCSILKIVFMTVVLARFISNATSLFQCYLTPFWQVYFPLRQSVSLKVWYNVECRVKCDKVWATTKWLDHASKMALTNVERLSS